MKSLLYTAPKKFSTVEVETLKCKKGQVLKIIGSFAQTNCFDRAIKFLENGNVRVDRLITHRFSLDEYEKGLHTVMDGSKSIKVLINP